AQYWLSVGAQPTEQVLALLKLTGDWGTFKGEKGAKNTVQTAEAKPVFEADTKKKPVLKPKAAENPVAEEAPAEEVVETPAEEVAETPAEETAAAEVQPDAETAEAAAPAEEAATEEA